LGYDLLSNLFRRTAIEEMMHVEKLAERILFLKGEAEMKASGEVKKIRDVKKRLELAAKMEKGSLKDYNNWANECSKNADSASKKIFETLVMMRNAISTSTIRKWKIWINLGTTI